MFNTFNITFSDHNEEVMPKSRFGELACDVLLFLNDFALVFCDVFEGKAEYDVSAGTGQSELNVRRRATH